MGQSPEERALRATVYPIVDDLMVAFGDFTGVFVAESSSAVSLWGYAPKPRASTIADAICFRFLPKSAYVTSGSQYPSRAFDFRGMSGGPLMKLAIPGTGPPALAEIAGVFAEWHSDIPCVAGASRRALLALLADKRV